MRITNQQALAMHNEAVAIRKKLKNIELYLEELFFTGSVNDPTPMLTHASVWENIAEIYASLDKQQTITSYALNGIPLKTEQNKIAESWSSALVEELKITCASVNLLKRNGIFSIKDLTEFLQKQSLTEIRGLGVKKAEQIEAALEMYLENKTKKKEGNNNG